MQTLEHLANALDAGRQSARALCEQALARIGDPAGEGARAFIHVDTEGALAAADYQDGLRRRGRAPSRYAGIPFSVKDLFDLAGEVTTAGSVVLAGAPAADSDAPAIARLKAAGFIVVGRTNMTEFAYSGVGLNPHYDTPRSLFDRTTGRIPGGSSSGAGVSVAENMVALSIGTDTGGSCRIPAAFNGIIGYKPSTGRVPTRGAFALSKTFDSVGPLARSVTCCALADALMAGERPLHPVPRDAGTVRLGVVRSMFFDTLDKEVETAFETALKTLDAAGVVLREVAFGELEALPQINANGGIVAAEAYAAHRSRIASDGERYDHRVRSRIESGAVISAADLMELRARQDELIARADELSEGLDGFVVPTVPILPPALTALDDDEDYRRINFLCLRNTFAGNFLKRCAISLPVTAPGQPPAGAMIMAPWGRDRALFSVAHGVEKALRSLTT